MIDTVICNLFASSVQSKRVIIMKRIRVLLLLILSFAVILPISGCGAPSEAEQRQAYLNVTDKVFDEAGKSKKIIEEVQQLIDQGKEKRNKILSFISTGSKVAKEAKQTMLDTAAPTDLGPSKQLIIDALAKRLEGYNYLGNYYDFLEKGSREKGEQLLKESYQMLDQAQKLINEARAK